MNASVRITTPARWAVLSLSALLLAAPALARDRQSTVTGPAGKTATYQSSRTQGQVSSSVTGANGQTASRNVSRTADSTTATVTGPKGQTASRVTTRTGGASATTVN